MNRYVFLSPPGHLRQAHRSLSMQPFSGLGARCWLETSFIIFSALFVTTSLPDVRRRVAGMENITLIWMSVKYACTIALGASLCVCMYLWTIGHKLNLIVCCMFITYLSSLRRFDRRLYWINCTSPQRHDLNLKWSKVYCVHQRLVIHHKQIDMHQIDKLLCGWSRDICVLYVQPSPTSSKH